MVRHLRAAETDVLREAGGADREGDIASEKGPVPTCKRVRWKNSLRAHLGQCLSTLLSSSDQHGHPLPPPFSSVPFPFLRKHPPRSSFTVHRQHRIPSPKCKNSSHILLSWFCSLVQRIHSVCQEAENRPSFGKLAVKNEEAKSASFVSGRGQFVPFFLAETISFVPHSVHAISLKTHCFPPFFIPHVVPLNNP